MPDEGLISLTDYLIELSHDFAKLQAFYSNRDGTVNNDSRLRPEHRDALIRGNLTELQSLVAEENASEGDTGIAAPPAPLLFVSPVLRPIN